MQGALADELAASYIVVGAADGASRGTLRDVADSLGISSAVALRALADDFDA